MFARCALPQLRRAVTYAAKCLRVDRITEAEAAGAYILRDPHVGDWTMRYAACLHMHADLRDFMSFIVNMEAWFNHCVPYLDLHPSHDNGDVHAPIELYRRYHGKQPLSPEFFQSAARACVAVDRLKRGLRVAEVRARMEATLTLGPEPLLRPDCNAKFQELSDDVLRTTDIPAFTDYIRARRDNRYQQQVAQRLHMRVRDAMERIVCEGKEHFPYFRQLRILWSDPESQIGSVIREVLFCAHDHRQKYIDVLRQKCGKVPPHPHDIVVLVDFVRAHLKAQTFKRILRTEEFWNPAN